MVKGVKSAITAVLVLFVLLLTAYPASAVTSTGTIKLLAVYEEDGKFTGSPADVFLEIKDGSGRVFLETIPLSKMDTQISTRFAKEIACKFSDVDCDKYDFFYTIRSSAGIVGGPSAGGAISALTVAMLEEFEVDQNTAMTGTINSGELIGPVGSLEAKIDAAKDAEIKRVLIPAVQATEKEDNETDIISYGKDMGVAVVPVATLSEALSELTGEEFEVEDKEVNAPETYITVMEEVAGSLCDRSAELMNEIDVADLSDDKQILTERVDLFKSAKNLSDKGKAAFEEGNTYSAASYCFGANVKAHTLLYDINNLEDEAIEEESEQLLNKIDDFDKLTEKREKQTITDLQTYMIVKERVLEARQHLIEGGNSSDVFGYVDERLNSAVAWSSFFNQEGETFNLDEESLQSSCAEIVGEVDERFQYLNLFFPGLLTDLKNNLLTAHKHYETGEYALCIYLAKRTKAEANIIVTMLGVREEVVDDVIDQKILAAKRAISRQIDEGIFPIIAYSYYEYATSLQENNPSAALLYSEYALELSDIDIYFDRQNKTVDGTVLMDALRKYLPTVIFIWGLVLGLLLCWIVMREKMKHTVPKPKVKKKAPQPKITTRTKLMLR